MQLNISETGLYFPIAALHVNVKEMATLILDSLGAFGIKETLRQPTLKSETECRQWSIICCLPRKVYGLMYLARKVT